MYNVGWVDIRSCTRLLTRLHRIKIEYHLQPTNSKNKNKKTSFILYYRRLSSYPPSTHAQKTLAISPLPWFSHLPGENIVYTQSSIEIFSNHLKDITCTRTANQNVLRKKRRVYRSQPKIYQNWVLNALDYHVLFCKCFLDIKQLK